MATTSTWTAADQTEASKASGQSNTVENFRNIIKAANISTSGTSIRIKIEARSGQTQVIEGCTIGEQDADEDFDGAPTQLEYSEAVISGENPLTATDSGVWTDWTTFSLDESKTYLVHIWNSAGFAGAAKWDADSGTHSYFNVLDIDYSQTVDFLAHASEDYISCVSEIEVEYSAAMEISVSECE